MKIILPQAQLKDDITTALGCIIDARMRVSVYILRGLCALASCSQRGFDNPRASRVREFLYSRYSSRDIDSSSSTLYLPLPLAFPPLISAIV